MAAWRVFTSAQLLSKTVRTYDFNIVRCPLRVLARTLVARVEKSQSCQVRQTQRSVLGCCPDFRDMAEGVSSGVTESTGICRRTNTE